MIGAGVTGLSCAHYLSRRGLSAVLLDPSPVGGMARTVQRDGFTLELGPNVMVEKPDMMELIDGLGLSDSVVRRTRPHRQQVWYRGAPVFVPRSPFQALRSPLVSIPDKLRFPVRLVRRSKLPADLDIDTFLGNIVGRSAVERIVEPVLGGIFGGKPAELSARMAFPEMWGALSEGRSPLEVMKERRARPRRRIFVLSGGVGSLISALERAVLRTGATLRPESASGLRRQDGIWEVSTSSGSTLRTRAVFVTTSGPASAPLLAPLAPALARRLGELRYAGIAVVHCSVSDPGHLPSDTFGVLFSRAPSRLLGVMYNSSIFPHVAPPGKALLTVSFGGADSGALLARSDAEIEALAESELSARLGVSARPMLVTRWARAIPQLPAGHHEMAGMMADLEREHPGLFLLGTDKGGVGVPDRVRMAREAVDKIETQAEYHQPLTRAV